LLRRSASTEELGRSAFQLRLPRHHLVRVNVEMLGDLCDCPIALDCRNRHLRLEGRGVIPPWSFAHRMLLIRRHNCARCQADDPLNLLFEIVEPDLSRHVSS
jgi:hypothetical protein